MASYSTVITGFSESDNKRTYQISGHTVQAPKLLIQKRKVPSTINAVVEDNIEVVYGTTNAAGEILASKVGFSANVRRPADGLAATNTAALAVFRDFVASDQFTAMVTGQSYMKE